MFNKHLLLLATLGLSNLAYAGDIDDANFLDNQSIESVYEQKDKTAYSLFLEMDALKNLTWDLNSDFKALQAGSKSELSFDEAKKLQTLAKQNKTNTKRQWLLYISNL